MKESDWFEEVSGLRHSGSEAHLILEMMQTNKSLLSALSREMGLPVSQLVLLRVLASVPPGGIGTLEIARMMGINGAAITRQVQNMEGRGLVIRRRDRSDGRKSYLRLSAKGRKLFQQIHQRIHEFEEFITAELEEQDIETVKRVLVQLRSALEKSLSK